MSRIFKAELFVVTAALLLPAGLAALAGPAAAETRTGGALAKDTKWTKDGSPYIITRDVVVPKGVTLWIEPGTTVRFKADIVDNEGEAGFDLELLVDGSLVVRGAAGDTVVLTSDAPVRKWSDWQGIVIRGQEARADIQAAVVEYANAGITCRDGALVARNMTVQKCEMRGFDLLRGKATLENVVVNDVGNFGGTGVGISVDMHSDATIENSFIIGAQHGIEFARRSTGRVAGTVISLCAARGLVIRNSQPEITGCTITRNELGVILSAGAAPRLHYNNIFENGVTDLVLQEYKDGIKVNVANNWWGVPSLGVIEEKVLDAVDDPTRGAFAMLEPLLTEAVATGTKPAAPVKKEP